MHAVLRMGVVIVLCLTTITWVFGQQDIPGADTITMPLAGNATELLSEADSVALVRHLLEKQLYELRGNERSRRGKIEAELAGIRRQDSLRKVEMVRLVAQLKIQQQGYPVVVHKDTLFYLYTNLGSLSPQERARVITERLQYVYKSFYPKTDTLALLDNGQVAELYYKDRIILSVTELDELWNEQPRIQIAREYQSLIVEDILRYKKDTSILKKLRAIGLVMLVILLQVAGIKWINYLFRGRVNRFLMNKRGVWFKGIHFRKLEIIDENRVTTAVIFMARMLRFFSVALLLYISIPVIFSIFPPTRRIAETLFGYLVSPLKVIAKSVLGYIPELMTIVVIVVITRYVLKFLRFVASELEAGKINLPGFYPDWAKPSYNIIRVLILAFMFIVIFPYLPGSDSPVFKGVSVFIGVVFSLGSSSIIGNMVAGLVITYMRPFKIGDRIKIGDVTGNVVEKTPFVTRIRTPKKEFITIPNSNVLSSNVINYSNSKLQGGLVVYTTVTIGYDVPWRKVHQLLINAAKKTSNLNLSIAPYVLQTSLDDFYVSYQLNAHTNEPDKQPLIYSELHQNIQDGFNEAGIEIMSPHYRAARDGNAMAIPREQWPEGYQPPGFKINQE